jgi:hypothetical protein
MNLKAILTEQPKRTNPVITIVFSVVIILLFTYGIWVLRISSGRQREIAYGNLIVDIMLMLNLLAFQIRLNPVLTALLRITASAWLIFTFWYVIRFYPIPQ